MAIAWTGSDELPIEIAEGCTTPVYRSAITSFVDLFSRSRWVGISVTAPAPELEQWGYVPLRAGHAVAVPNGIDDGRVSIVVAALRTPTPVDKRRREGCPTGLV